MKDVLFIVMIAIAALVGGCTDKEPKSKELEALLVVSMAQTDRAIKIGESLSVSVDSLKAELLKANAETAACYEIISDLKAERKLEVE